ncbi:hypothetical protein C8Q70DRAFT_270975 [Cubamyces menziesii]|uniref:Extracellular membrane protein CFEM domain-containing protein n=1 Tax=Trametes cubensis TaxID=1111947 RepID=A0AAD7TWS9_9APHY|nr:hypothetical protein C8Q70DRAFT_270975 [Cubamyces menziesii]KAJ8487827.1 hypothetical protein ONZ51_g3921 [Trametes cubensis]
MRSFVLLAVLAAGITAAHALPKGLQSRQAFPTVIISECAGNCLLGHGLEPDCTNSGIVGGKPGQCICALFGGDDASGAADCIKSTCNAEDLDNINAYVDQACSDTTGELNTRSASAVDEIPGAGQLADANSLLSDGYGLGGSFGGLDGTFGGAFR